MCKFIKQEDKDEIYIFIGFYIIKKMEVSNKESAPYVDLLLTFEKLKSFFDRKEIDLTSMKEDKYKNASFSGKVFGRCSYHRIAVKQSLVKNASNFELKEQFASGLCQCKIILN